MSSPAIYRRRVGGNLSTISDAKTRLLVEDGALVGAVKSRTE